MENGGKTLVRSAAEEVTVEFNILGPLEVTDASGTAVRIPAGRERALLVALLLRRGEVVSVDALVDALWGERPPSTAAKAVQGYVSHLRRLLGAGAADVLVTQTPGYVLRAGDSQVDSARFERLASDGRRALEDGDPTGALEILESALALWRGPPLAEFAFDDFAQREIQRLTERRLEAAEDRVDALLELGRHGGLVSELEAVVASHPLRERSRGQLMLALYRSGRPADALHAYKEGARVSRELGLDPAPELKALERSILEQDPALGPPAHGPAPPAAEPVARQTPRRRRTVVAGAAAVLAVLAVAALAFDRTRGSPGAVTVVPPAVAAIDPETNSVVASIRVGSKPVTMAAGDGAVWVGDARDGTVTRIDPETRTVVKTIGVGAPAIDIAAGGGNVWVATGGFGTVVKVDAELNVEVDTIELGSLDDPVVPSVSAVAAGPEGVWLGAFEGLVRIDPSSGEIMQRVDLDQKPALQIALGNGAVWSTINSSRARRVDARSAQETAEFYAGVFVYAIALDRTAVWVAGGDQGQLWKLDPVTGTTLLTARAGSWVEGIALANEAVWATQFEPGVLVRVDPTTGAEDARIPLGGIASEVVVANGLVWVAVHEAEDEDPSKP